MRISKTLALLLPVAAAQPLHAGYDYFVTPEDNGTKTRFAWVISGAELTGVTATQSTTLRGMPTGTTSPLTTPIFKTDVSVYFNGLTTGLVFENVTKGTSLTYDWLFFEGNGSAHTATLDTFSGIIAVSAGDTLRLSGNTNGSVVVNFDYSKFNPGYYSNYPAAFGAASLTVSPIPEPSTYGLILGGLALAGAAVIRRRKSA